MKKCIVKRGCRFKVDDTTYKKGQPLEVDQKTYEQYGPEGVGYLAPAPPLEEKD